MRYEIHVDITESGYEIAAYARPHPSVRNLFYRPDQGETPLSTLGFDLEYLSSFICQKEIERRTSAKLDNS